MGNEVMAGHNVLGLTEGLLYVVIWEPRSGRASGHQLALDREKADTISRTLSRAMPDALIRIEHADSYAAAAVMEPRQQRRGYQPTRKLPLGA
jgi:hypothetical protein